MGTRMNNSLILYSLAALYIALTEAMAEATGKEIGPLANHLIEGMLPVLPTDAANLCEYLVEFTSSRDCRAQQTANTLN